MCNLLCALPVFKKEVSKVLLLKKNGSMTTDSSELLKWIAIWLLLYRWKNYRQQQWAMTSDRWFLKQILSAFIVQNIHQGLRNEERVHPQWLTLWCGFWDEGISLCMSFCAPIFLAINNEINWELTKNGDKRRIWKFAWIFKTDGTRARIACISVCISQQETTYILI